MLLPCQRLEGGRKGGKEGEREGGREGGMEVRRGRGREGGEGGGELIICTCRFTMLHAMHITLKKKPKLKEVSTIIGCQAV